MHTFGGSLVHRIATANPTHLIWGGAIVIVMIVLAILHHLWKEDTKKLSIWRILCLIPLVACMIHFMVYVWGFPPFLDSCHPLYLIGGISLLPILFARRKIGYRITTVITGLVTGLCDFFLLGLSPNYFNT